MNTVAAIGHNSSELRTQLDASELLTRKDELLASAGRAPESITDDETAGKVGDLIKLIRAARKAWNAIFDPLDDAKDTLQGRMAAHITTKPAGSQTRGDYGSVAGLRTTWDYEVTSINMVPRHMTVINDAAVRAHIKARPKDQPPAPILGLRFFTKNSAVVR